MKTRGRQRSEARRRDTDASKARQMMAWTAVVKNRAFAHLVPTNSNMPGRTNVLGSEGALPPRKE